jgi:PhoPQ-activated pathogenicity-related protein
MWDSTWHALPAEEVMQKIVVVSRDVQRGKVLPKVREHYQRSRLLLEQLPEEVPWAKGLVKRASTQEEVRMLL